MLVLHRMRRSAPAARRRHLALAAAVAFALGTLVVMVALPVLNVSLPL
jgi:hypothetical protein